MHNVDDTLATLTLTRPKTSEKKKKKRRRNANEGAQINNTWRKPTKRRQGKKTRDANGGARIILGKKNMKSAEKRENVRRGGRGSNNT